MTAFSPRFALCAGLALLAGCTSTPSPADRATAAGPLTTVYSCGGRRAVVTTTGQTARVQIDNQSFDMTLARSASGARYEAGGDASTVFWSKGERATLTLRGRDLPECVPAKVALPLRATGNEPFWRLDLDAGAMTLTTDLGARRVATGAPAVTRSGDATLFSARAGGEEIVASVVDRVCVNNMSGMPHPYGVTVRDGARTLRGCGGEPAALLRARSWVVEDIDRRGIVDRTRVSLDFDDAGRVSGSTGCNDFAGRYALTGEGLSLRDLASTRKACAPALMEQETRFLAALRRIQRFEIAPDGALRLVSGTQTDVLAR